MNVYVFMFMGTTRARPNRRPLSHNSVYIWENVAPTFINRRSIVPIFYVLCQCVHYAFDNVVMGITLSLVIVYVFESCSQFQTIIIYCNTSALSYTQRPRNNIVYKLLLSLENLLHHHGLGCLVK